MFYTSSLASPTDQFRSGAQDGPCKNDCSGGWFGWTSPVTVPGRLTGFSQVPSKPYIQIGAAPTTDAFEAVYPSGNQFSFDGGIYRDKFVSALLTPGNWRIFAAWIPTVYYANGSPFPSPFVFPASFDVAASTDLLVKNSLSLVDKNETEVRALTLLDSSQFANGLNPPFFRSSEIGGVDGCGHFFDQTSMDFAKVRGIDITIAQRQQVYLKAVNAPGAAIVTDQLRAAFPGIDTPEYHAVYQVGAFYLNNCRCGGFLESSVAAGF